jgi:hypothetical protein
LSPNSSIGNFTPKTTPGGDKSCRTSALKQTVRSTSRLVPRDRLSARRQTRPCH